MEDMGVNCVPELLGACAGKAEPQAIASAEAGQKCTNSGSLTSRERASSTGSSAAGSVCTQSRAPRRLKVYDPQTLSFKELEVPQPSQKEAEPAKAEATEKAKFWVMNPEIRRIVDQAYRHSFDREERTRFAIYLSSPESRARAEALSDPQPEYISDAVLKEAVEVAEVDKASRASLYSSLTSGTTTIVPVVRPNPHKDELEARLQKLRFRYEQSQYDRLTSSVTYREQAERDREPLSAFWNQLGLGLDMQVMVLCGALIGYGIGQVKGWDVQTRWILAAAGTVLMIVVEGILFVIKFGRMDRQLPGRASSLGSAGDKAKGKAKPQILRSSAAPPRTPPTAEELRSKKTQ
eukprot:RCo024876